MANLRANNVCGTDGRNAITGSVEIDGSGDYLSIPNTSDFRLGNSDFTIEGWAYLSAFGTNRTLFALFENATARRSYQLEVRTTGTVRFEWWYDGSTANNIDSASGIISLGSWNHYAVVRNGSTLTLYINGVSANSSNVGTNSFFENTTEPFLIGGNLQSAVFSQSWQGFVSNFRLIKGTALYTQNFIPPTRKLIRLPGTVLLCCQDNASATTEATGKTITANGNPTARKFVPQVGSDGGLVFDGVTKVNTQNYFYLPTGVTENREPAFPGVSASSARGVFGGGQTPTIVNTIDYITISSAGNAADFGDLTTARKGLNCGACSSPTRGVFGGGYTPTHLNTIDYITINSTGNAQDFGDLTQARSFIAACSSSTRGLFGGGFQSPANYNIIDYITIASSGNAVDFGDATQIRGEGAACSSTTRGVFGGGNVTPSEVNTIDYVTISSTGNAVTFGSLTQARRQHSACSSSTRGIFAGGATPTIVNTVDYITIASTGTAIDFGDLTQSRRGLAACASSTRGVFGGGQTPTVVNTIDYITILTTGNATDFGDLFEARLEFGACSNGHGGLG